MSTGWVTAAFSGFISRATPSRRSARSIDTRNAAYNKLIERVEQVAVRSRAPILLMGPTGAGKSQLARRVFELKKARRQVSGELCDVNCATLRGDGAMSALFGHVKGAFTGALEARAGLLRKAHGGVLFLDEIGELGADEPAMLLRAVEEKAFFPVGSDREVKSDFVLVAGTNKDLDAEAEAGRFREDLLARINLWTFRLPASVCRGRPSRSLDRAPARPREGGTMAGRRRPHFHQESPVDRATLAP